MPSNFKKTRMLTNFNLNVNSPQSTNDTPGQISSPVTNLAHNLSELSTGRYTPKRKLSLNLSTPSPSLPDSPTPVESPSFINRSDFKNFVPAIPSLCKLSFDHFSSPLCVNQRYVQNDIADETNDYDLQSEQEDANSQDSGLGLEKDKDSFQFLPPVGMPPRKVKIFDEDTCEPIKYSPSKFQRSFSASLINKEEIEFLQSDNSPKKQARRTLSGESADDGFSDHLESLEMAENPADMSDGIKSLMEAPLSCAPTEKTNIDLMSENVKSSLNDTPTAMRKGMSRSQSFDIRRRLSSKRDRISDENTPVISKRRKPIFNGNNGPSKIHVAPVVRYQRSHSETEAQIKSAVHKITQNPQLIGDGSMPYCLPTIPGKHKDLKSITPETMRSVLRGEYDDVIESCKIIDCRYPYEFIGGHILNGQNDYTKEIIMKKFLQIPPVLKNSNKRTLLVFHCEFSSERAPKLARFLRNMDRSANKDCYPSLYYPEIYILDGGYKAFFESASPDYLVSHLRLPDTATRNATTSFKIRSNSEVTDMDGGCVIAFMDMCEPPTYKPMLHPDHSSDLKRFRAKSKSWAGERAPRPGLRQLNF